jgi:hypothetical protein
MHMLTTTPCEMAISFLFELKLNDLVKSWKLEKKMGHNLTQIS